MSVEHALQHNTGMLNIHYSVDEGEHLALICEDFLDEKFGKTEELL